MKRKVDDSDIDVSDTDSETEQVGEEIVNVDFDFFDLNPDVDFHATKTFLTQLFGDDAQEMDISGLADIILAKNSVGTTIKTDGKESDPFALLSVVNMNTHAKDASIKKLVKYLLSKTASSAELNITLKKLLLETSKLRVGLIVSERMINMPVEVVPPLYKMLLEEMARAEDAHERYEFDYYLVVSKVYQLVSAEVTDDEAKSKKKKVTEPQVEMDYFHYEDTVLEKNAQHHGVFDYTHVKQNTDLRRVFTEYGIDPKLSVILLDRESLAKLVPEMEAAFPPF